MAINKVDIQKSTASTGQGSTPFGLIQSRNKAKIEYSVIMKGFQNLRKSLIMGRLTVQLLSKICQLFTIAVSREVSIIKFFCFILLYAILSILTIGFRAR